MAESIDTLQRQVSKLSMILQAQQSGLPSRLVVLVTGKQARTDESIEQIISERLKGFGLDDQSHALEAGCEVTVAALPWLTGRAVGRQLAT